VTRTKIEKDEKEITKVIEEAKEAEKFS